MIKIDFSELISLCDKLSHRVEEQDETINYLQDKNKKLHCDITDLQTELSDSKNDLQQATNEIKLLNNQIGNLQRNIGYLCEENRKLRDTINAYEQLF